MTVVSLIKRCHEEILKDSPRALTSIVIDDRPAKTDSLDEKVKSVEKKVGREVRK
jgi:uncharacterized protein YqgV (UPF0045/DUF77 family)